MDKLHPDATEATQFVRSLHDFHRGRGTDFKFGPKVGGRDVDLHALYKTVTAAGGSGKLNERPERWLEIAYQLHFPERCSNATLVLRQIYQRYLSAYEKVTFLGEDPDLEVEDAGETSSSFRGSRTSTRSGGGGSGAFVIQVPMSYNRQQHEVTDGQRSNYGLSTTFASPQSPFERLCFSLQSGLPNEEAFALNVCTLLANGSGRHVMQLAKAPSRFVDLLVAQAGVDAANDPTLLRDIFTNTWKKCEGRRMRQFWFDQIDRAALSRYRLSEFMPLLINRATVTDSGAESVVSCASLSQQNSHRRKQHQSGRDREAAVDCDAAIGRAERNSSPSLVYEALSIGAEQQFTEWEETNDDELLFNLEQHVTTRDAEAQRVLRIALVLHNLTFDEGNAQLLATNASFLRFMLFSAICRWPCLRHVGLDAIANVAAHLPLNVHDDIVCRALLRLIIDGIMTSEDRGLVTRCLTVLTQLAQCEANQHTLISELDRHVLERLLELLTAHDLSLIIHSLETLYALSELGDGVCERLIGVGHAIGLLVSMLSLDPIASYGAASLRGVKIVEQHLTGTTSHSGETALQHQQHQSLPVHQYHTATGVTTANALHVNPASPVPTNVVSAQQQPYVGRLALPGQPPPLHGTILKATQNQPQSSPGTTVIAAPPRLLVTSVPHHHHHHQHSLHVQQQQHTQIASASQQTKVAQVLPAPLSQGASSASGCNDIATVVSETESLAASWVRAHVELSSGSSVGRQELYADYVNFCSKAGRRNVLSGHHFSTCIRSIYPQCTLKVTQVSTPSQQTVTQVFQFDNLRRRAVPLPITVLQAQASQSPLLPTKSTAAAVTVTTAITSTVSPNVQLSTTTPVKSLFGPLGANESVIVADGSVAGVSLSMPLSESSAGVISVANQQKENFSESLVVETGKEKSSQGTAVSAKQVVLSVDTDSGDMVGSILKAHLSAPRQCLQLVPSEEPSAVATLSKDSKRTTDFSGVAKDSNIISQSREAPNGNETAVSSAEVSAPSSSSHLTGISSQASGSNSSNLIKSLLASKVSRNMQRHLQQQNQATPAPLINKAVESLSEGVSPAQNQRYQRSRLLAGGASTLNRQQTSGQSAQQRQSHAVVSESSCDNSPAFCTRASQLNGTTGDKESSTAPSAPSSTASSVSVSSSLATKEPGSASASSETTVVTRDSSSQSKLHQVTRCMNSAVLRSNGNHEAVTSPCTPSSMDSTTSSLAASNATGVAGCEESKSLLISQQQSQVYKSSPLLNGLLDGGSSGGPAAMRAVLQSQQHAITSDVVTPTVNGKKSNSTTLATSSNGTARSASSASTSSDVNSQSSTPECSSLHVANGEVSVNSTPTSIVTRKRRLVFAVDDTNSSVNRENMQDKAATVANKNSTLSKLLYNGVASDDSIVANDAKRAKLDASDKAKANGDVNVRLQKVEEASGKLSINNDKCDRKTTSSKPTLEVPSGGSDTEGSSKGVASSVAAQVSLDGKTVTVVTPIQATTAKADTVTGIKVHTPVQVTTPGNTKQHICGSAGQIVSQTLTDHGSNSSTPSISERRPLRYFCEWRGCDQSFSTPRHVLVHAVYAHVGLRTAARQLLLRQQPRLLRQLPPEGLMLCQWGTNNEKESCDGMVRRRLSLCTHVQDRHCSEALLHVQAIRRQQIAQFGTASIPLPPQPPPQPGYAADAAALAIRRHAVAFHSYRDAADEREHAVTRSVRLTAALVLRNLARYVPIACRQRLRQYEARLAQVAMSGLESSRTIAQCLAELYISPQRDSPSRKSALSVDHMQLFQEETRPRYAS